MSKRVLSLLLCVCMTVLIFQTISVNNAEASPVSASWSGEADTDWYDPSGIDFTLHTAEELAGLAELVNSNIDNFAGKTAKKAVNRFPSK